MANTRDLWIFLRARDEASRVVRGFAQTVRTSALTVRAAQLDAQAQQLRQRASLARYFGLSNSYIRHLNDQATALHNQATALRISAAQARDNDKSIGNLTQRISAANQMLFLSSVAFAAFGAAGLIALRKTIDVAVEYERQVRHTITQIDRFGGKLQDIGDIGLRIAREIAVPFEQIQPALFDIFSSMEVGVADAEILLKAFSKGAVAGQTEIQSVSRATIGLLNSFQLPAKEVNRLLDIQFQLIQEGVGTYDEWNERIGLVTPSAVRAGQSIEVMMAALAAATRMGLSAARAGTSVARAFDALSHPKTIANLKNLGVNSLTASGKMRPLNEVLKDFRQVLLKLPEPKRLEVILDVFKGAGGTIEARRFIQNMLLVGGNIETFEDILNEMKNSSGAFENAYKTMADSVSSKSQLLSNRWKILQESIGKALIPSFLKLVNWLSKVVDNFNKLPTATKNAVVMFVLVASFASIALAALLLFGTAIGGIVLALTIAGPIIIGVFGVIAGGVIGVIAAAVALHQLSKGSKKVGESFDKLRTAIKDAWEASKPIFAEMKKIWETQLKPVIDKIVEKLRNDLSKAMDNVTEIINKRLIPTIKDLANWYKDHKQEVDAFIELLGDLAKAFGAVLGMLIVLFGTALGGWVIVSILTFIEMMKFMVENVGGAFLAMKKIWENLKSFWNDTWGAVKSFFIDVWNAISSFFVDVWEKIKNAAKAAWEFIVDVFKVALGFIRGMWEDFWSVFGGLIKAVWELIVALIELGMAAVELAILVGLETIKTIWNNTWEFVKNLAKSVWDGITEFFTKVWEAIVKHFRSIWDPIVAIWNAIWDKIGGKVEGTTSGISETISKAWNFAKQVTIGVWNEIFGSVSEFLQKIWDKVKSVFTGIRDWMLSVSHWFRDAGKSIIQAIIDGITSKIKEVTDIVKDLTKKIKDLLPHSPAKRGPLSGRGSPFFSGQAISTMLANGIKSRQGLVQLATAQLGRQIGSLRDMQIGAGPMNPPHSAPVGNGTVEPTSKTINNTFNINTQEIDPRKHAAALGWELQARM